MRWAWLLKSHAQYVAFNHSSNCIKGVEISERSVIVSCPWQNYSDARINSWTVTSQYKSLKAIKQSTVVKEDFPWTKVSCFPGKFYVSGLLRSCSPYSFILKSDVGWNTSDYKHESVPMITYSVESKIILPDYLTKVAFNSTSRISDKFVDEILQMRAILDESQAKLNYSRMLDSVGENVFETYHSLTYLIFIVIIVLLICFLCKSIKKAMMPQPSSPELSKEKADRRHKFDY